MALPPGTEVDLSDNPDFVQVAQAFGIDAFRITTAAEVPGAIQRIYRSKGPLLVHVVLERETNVWPLVAPGKSNAEMLEETA